MKSVLVKRKPGELYQCSNKCGASYTHDQARDHLMNKCPKREKAHAQFAHAVEAVQI